MENDNYRHNSENVYQKINPYFEANISDNGYLAFRKQIIQAGDRLWRKQQKIFSETIRGNLPVSVESRTAVLANNKLMIQYWPG